MSTPPPPHGNDPYAPYPPPGQPPPGPPQPPYSPPGPYMPGPYTQPGALQPPNNGLSIASLIVGISSVPLALCCIGLGPVTGIVGVILGFVARNLIGVIFVIVDLIFFGLSLSPLASGSGD